MLTLTTVNHGKALVPLLPEHCLSEKDSHTFSPTEKCPKPQWDKRVQFSEDESEYPQNKELALACPEGLKLSFPKVKCTKELQGVSSGKPVYGDAWWGRNSTGAWTRIEGAVLCMGK